MDWTNMFIWLMISLEVVSTYFHCPRIYQFWSNRMKYPIKQLSPWMTLIQSLFFFIIQVFLIVWIWIYPFDQSCKDKQKQVDDESLVDKFLVVSFFYLFSRGCCFSFVILKTFRISQAFQNRTLNGKCLTSFFKKERYLIFIGIIYGFVGFPLVTYLTTKLRFDQEFQCSLYIYEKNYYYVIINSVLEELLALGLMQYLNINHLSGKLYELSYNPLLYYMIWFMITCSFAWFDDVIVGEIVSLLTIFSFWLRAHFMLYYYIHKPLKLIEECPSLYIQKSDILNFQVISSPLWQTFYSQQKISSCFEKYLEYIDQNRSTMIINNEKLENSLVNKSQKQLYKVYLELRKHYGACTEDKFYSIIEQEFSEINEIEQFKTKSQQKLFKEWTSHLQTLYEGYCQTKSFQTLARFYDQNQVYLDNLEILGINVDQQDQLSILRFDQNFGQLN